MAGKSTKETPKAGDKYRCDTCGTEVRLENDSKEEPQLECCGQAMTKSP